MSEHRAKMDKDGILHLQRRESEDMKKVYCPYNPYGLGCGTWCALFDYYSNNGTTISLCQKKYILTGVFYDERIKR